MVKFNEDSQPEPNEDDLKNILNQFNLEGSSKELALLALEATKQLNNSTDIHLLLAFFFMGKGYDTEEFEPTLTDAMKMIGKFCEPKS